MEVSVKSQDIIFLSQAMGVMDYFKQEKGFPLYSYPPSIKINCDNAKSYHFWMAAYMAREIVKEKVASTEEAAKGSYLSQKGY